MITENSLEGNVERITYYSADTGYCVLRLAPDQPPLNRRGETLMTVVGTMPELQPGERVRFTGQWTNHPVHGQQFKSETVTQLRPATIEGIQRYLGSGLIRGVGDKTAKKIVDFFGAETLDVLDRMPEKVRDVPGVGKHKAGLIAKAWQEQRTIKEVMIFLQGHGLNTSLALRIYKTYGDDSIQRVQEDPYNLVKEIYGVGFKTADRLARDLGLPIFAPTRLTAGIVYALNDATNNGHVFMPTEELLKVAAELLEVEEGLLDEALNRLCNSGEVVLEDLPAGEADMPTQAAYHAAMYYSEKGVASRLHRMMDTTTSRLQKLSLMPPGKWDMLIANITSEGGVALSEQQKRAVHMALTNKVAVLTGGPGTGKTTTLRTIIGILESTGHKFKLASPTGRAAKRLAEATGHPAQTIHRLLGFAPAEGFTYNEDNPLNTDMVVVDEASMIDLVLFYNLLKALRPETHLLLVGDVDQLPSVGAGDVLRDIIRSAICPVSILETIFRQEGGSMIIQNAHRINQGQTPDTSNSSNDFFFFAEEDPQEAAQLLVDIVQNRISQKFGHDPLDDIQVLAPMYMGKIGVNALNDALQQKLNPPGRKAEKLLAGRLFRVGDKVMQTRNNYEKEVFNGDIGRVHSIDMQEHVLNVMIDGRLIMYDWLEADELVHAFAISVHKSQGAEYPVVVMPILTQHYMMLQRNLLYTAITRAKKMVVLVGTRKAIAIAVNSNEVARRWSALAWRLGV